MSYPVRYSTRAYQEYEEILDYVSGQFGAAVAARVDIYFEEVIDQIAINPNSSHTRIKGKTFAVA